MTSKKKLSVTNSDSMFVIEYASTKDSKCQWCDCEKPSIAKGELRVGKLTKSKYGSMKYDTGYKMLAKWFHPSCMFQELMNARLSTHVILEPNDFRVGWDNLTKEDKQQMEKEMKIFGTEREKIQNEKEKEKEDKKAKQKEEKKRKALGEVDDENESKKSKITIPEHLVKATFSHDLLMNIFNYFSRKELLLSSCISRVFYKSSREVLFKHKGLEFVEKLEENKEFTDPPVAISSKLSTMILESFKKKYSILKSFTNLTSLALYGGSYNSALTEYLPNLTQLTELKLEEMMYSSTNSKSLSDAISHLPLRSLHIQGCQSVVLSISSNYFESFAKLTSLTSLTLARQAAQVVFPISPLTSLVNLSSLDLTYGTKFEITSFIPTLSQLPSLTSLKFQKFADFPETFDMSSLVKLSHLLLDSLHGVVLPPNLLSLTTFQGKEIVGLPVTLKEIHLQNLFEPPTEQLIKNIPAQCHIHLYYPLDGFAVMPPVIMERIYYFHIRQSHWPKGSEKLKIIERIPNSNPIPPIIRLDLNMSICSYKKKVYETVNAAKAKATNIFMVNYY